MIIPFNIRENKGSFVMTLPKSIGLNFGLDLKFKDRKIITLIAETVENGVLLRYPIEEEEDRFEL